MKIKGLLAAGLVLSLLLSGCGAVVPTEGSVEPPRTDVGTTEATQAPTTEAPTTEGATVPAETEPITREKLVTEAYRDEYTRSDGVVVLHSIPKINLPGAYAEEINETLRELYDGQQDDEGVLPWTEPYSYEDYVFGDILSVVVRNASVFQIEDRQGFDIAGSYRIYTLRISDGSQVTLEEILKLAGVTEEEFYQRVAVAAGDACCTYVPAETIEEQLAQDDPASTFIVQQFRRSISEEFVSKAIPYFNEAGELWFAADICHIAGAGDHMVLRPYEQMEPLSPYYEQVHALIGEE